MDSQNQNTRFARRSFSSRIAPKLFHKVSQLLDKTSSSKHGYFEMGEGHDDNDATTNDNTDSTGEEISAIALGESSDAIEEAWEDGEHGELCFHRLSLDRPAVLLLLEKLRGLYELQLKQGKVLKIIQKVELYACSFADESCAVLFVQFLQRLGPQLKELFIVDTFTKKDTSSPEERASSLLQGLHRVPQLERLAIDLSDFRGDAAGTVLQKFLSRSGITTLRLNDAEMDDAMWISFLDGLGEHPTGLVHLDMDGWYLGDLQFKILVNTLVRSKSAQTLQTLNLSRSDITSKSLSSLACLIQGIPSLRELVLQNCQYLWRKANIDSEPVCGFLRALRNSNGSTSNLEELRLGPSPPKDVGLAIVQAGSHLQALYLEGFEPTLVACAATPAADSPFKFSWDKYVNRISMNEMRLPSWEPALSSLFLSAF